jgi:phosphoribosylaminoimidazole-succinocarboxamide synthase
MKVIYSGKSKDLIVDSNNYFLRFKNVMRAGDGRFFDMPVKAVILTSITSKIFNYLNAQGVETHFVQQTDLETIEVKKLEMLPFEFVVRRYAEGSYLKRNPKIKRYTKFVSPVFEIFFKDDSQNDPLVTPLRSHTH